ncbi:MAG: glycosyltransferase family 2 protein [Chloroflexi bacterium]|nr:glycosyltransferase family 2 protein [Chloroflexota bacterium]
MPVRNGELDLPRSIGSLLNQNFSDFELVVCDNDSTDGTRELLRKLSKEDPRVSVHLNKTNIGHLANFDKVLQLARGEYFMWASADDFWHPEFASALIDELDSDPGADAAVSAIKRVTPTGDDVDTIRFPMLSGQKSISRIALATVIASGYANRLRYHLLFYSIFRRDFVQSGMPYPAVSTVYPDRTFMTQFALGGKFAYVNRPLMVKTFDTCPSQNRWAEEDFGSALTEDSWKFLKSSLAIAPLLVRSNAVPLHQKLFIPAVMIAAMWGYRFELYSGGSRWMVPFRSLRRVTRLIVRRKWKI